MKKHILFLRFLLKGDKSQFDVPAVEQENFLESLRYPKDDIDRSYLQYRCQNFFSRKSKTWLFNFISSLLFFPVLLLEIVWGISLKPKRHIEAITDIERMEDILPESLLKQYNVESFNWFNRGGLKLKDILYVLKFFFHYFPSSYFSLKAMLRVSQYSKIITQFSPLCIIAHSEYSFTSSILTDYCHRRGVKHVNVMHGEKLFYIRDSFFHFDECYIWHKHYKDLFLKMRTEPSQFVIYQPLSLVIDSKKFYVEKSYADYKYYLAVFDENEIQSIIASLSFLKKRGKSIKYRLHPRYLHLSTIHKYLTEDEIENPSNVSILESIASCNTVIGSYSTVLTQAFYSGKKVILDDVTYNEYFYKLKDLMYILATENCKKLSDLQLSNKCKGV